MASSLSLAVDNTIGTRNDPKSADDADRGGFDAVDRICDSDGGSDSAQLVKDGVVGIRAGTGDRDVSRSEDSDNYDISSPEIDVARIDRGIVESGDVVQLSDVGDISELRELPAEEKLGEDREVDRNDSVCVGGTSELAEIPKLASQMEDGPDEGSDCLNEDLICGAGTADMEVERRDFGRIGDVEVLDEAGTSKLAEVSLRNDNVLKDVMETESRLGTAEHVDLVFEGVEETYEKVVVEDVPDDTEVTNRISSDANNSGESPGAQNASVIEEDATSSVVNIVVSSRTETIEERMPCTEVMQLVENEMAVAYENFHSENLVAADGDRMSSDLEVGKFNASELESNSHVHILEACNLHTSDSRGPASAEMKLSEEVFRAIQESDEMGNEESSARCEIEAHDHPDLKVFGENETHSTGYLSRQAADGFLVSDLVWGKVKSHPWWPGQIFDASDASDLALKYQKKDAFLVAYFGDKTFAWCDESQLKPFEAYFSQMEKQSNSDTFVNALNGALEEVSRRTELEMICSCLPEEATSSISCKRFDNAGIRKGSSGHDVGNLIAADCLEPGRILEFVKALACFPNVPNEGTNRLELMKTIAQLKAFYKSKGFFSLPSFHIGGELIEEDVGEIHEKNDIEHSTPNSTGSKFEKQKSKGRPGLLSKQKKALEDGNKDKSMFESMEVEDASHIANKSKTKIDASFDGESLSVSSGKRCKATDSDYSDSGTSKKKKLDTVFGKETKLTSPAMNSFKIGDRIRRVASQLTKAAPTLKSPSENSQKNETEDDGVFDVFTAETPCIVEPEPEPMSIEECQEGLIAEDLLLELCLAASDPTSACSSAFKIITFLSKFRNFTVYTAIEANIKVGSKKRGRKKKADVQPSSSDLLAVDHMQDAYWSDMTYHNNSSNGVSIKGEGKLQSRRKKRKPPGKMSPALTVAELQGGEQLQVGVTSPNPKLSPKVEIHIIRVEEKMAKEYTPTALVLNFNLSKPLPSETDLIRIFSRYGPLQETATKVQKKKNRVKVVFKRRADADVAFSSAGKYSIFGPSLLSYQLKYLTSTPDSTSDKNPQDENDEMFVDTSSSDIPDSGVLPDPGQIEGVTQESVHSIQNFDEKNNDMHVYDNSFLVHEQTHKGALVDNEGLEILTRESVEGVQKLDVRDGDMVASDFIIPAQTYGRNVIDDKRSELGDQESAESIQKLDEQNEDMLVDPSNSYTPAQVHEGVFGIEMIKVVTHKSVESVQKLDEQSLDMLASTNSVIPSAQEPVQNFQKLDEQNHDMLVSINDSIIPETQQPFECIQKLDEKNNYILESIAGEFIASDTQELVLSVQKLEQNDDLHIAMSKSVISAQMHEGASSDIEKLEVVMQESFGSVQKLDEQSLDDLVDISNSVIPDTHDSVEIFPNLDEQPAEAHEGFVLGAGTIEVTTQKSVDEQTNGILPNTTNSLIPAQTCEGAAPDAKQIDVVAQESVESDEK